MTYFYKLANTFVPFLIAFMLSLSVGLASPNMANIQKLLIELKSPSNRAHSEVEKEIWAEWSRSGDQNLDMLLIRGRFFMQSGRLEETRPEYNGDCHRPPRKRTEGKISSGTE